MDFVREAARQPSELRIVSEQHHVLEPIVELMNDAQQVADPAGVQPRINDDVPAFATEPAGDQLRSRQRTQRRTRQQQVGFAPVPRQPPARAPRVAAPAPAERPLPVAEPGMIPTGFSVADEKQRLQVRTPAAYPMRTDNIDIEPPSNPVTGKLIGSSGCRCARVYSSGK